MDYRQPFEEIARFDSAGWKIEEYSFEPNEDWGSVENAAEFHCKSLSTVRRFLDKLAGSYGQELLPYHRWRTSPHPFEVPTYFTR